MLLLTYAIKNSHTLEDIWEKTLLWLENSRSWTWICHHQGVIFDRNKLLDPWLIDSTRSTLCTTSRLAAAALASRKTEFFFSFLPFRPSLLARCIMVAVIYVNYPPNSHQRVHMDGEYQLYNHKVWAPTVIFFSPAFFFSPTLCVDNLVVVGFVAPIGEGVPTRSFHMGCYIINERAQKKFFLLQYQYQGL